MRAMIPAIRCGVAAGAFDGVSPKEDGNLAVYGNAGTIQIIVGSCESKNLDRRRAAA